MSLVSTYIRATDGFLYRNPVLSGEDWFICFDDEDPVELVIKRKSKLRPKKILDSIGLKYTRLKYHAGENGGYERDFGRTGDFEFEEAVNFFFDITNRIDPKFITKHDGKIESQKEAGQGVFYDP